MLEEAGRTLLKIPVGRRPFDSTARKSSTWLCALKIVPSNAVPSHSVHLRFSCRISVMLPSRAPTLAASSRAR
jgi:hypothetical protein